MGRSDPPQVREGGDATSADDDSDTPAQAVNDEELYAAYLAARVQQALEALEAVRRELALQPNDFNRALQVIRKVQELRELRRELDAQRARVRATRAAAGFAPDSPHGAPGPAQTRPGPGFRAAQAQRAARIMAALAMKPRTCPACQALLTTDTERCHCGYAFGAAPVAARRDAPPN